MYGYGNSGGGVGGIVFGILLGVVVVFFVCRELMCWYYKINKMASLLEEQNILLKTQMTFVPTHTVKLLTDADGLSLRNKASPDADVIEKLPNGTKVQFVEKGSEVELDDVKGTWFRVITQEKTIGWCFAGKKKKV
jgi:uncharacterized protein YgiM (DUF1202 family)